MLRCFEIFTDELASPTHVVWAASPELAVTWSQAVLSTIIRIVEATRAYPMVSAGVVRRIGAAPVSKPRRHGRPPVRKGSGCSPRETTASFPFVRN